MIDSDENPLLDFPCYSCGEVSTLACQTKNSAADTYQVPLLILSACGKCGTWLKYESQEPRKISARDVPTLTPWAAFFFGHMLTELIAREEAQQAIIRQAAMALDALFDRGAAKGPEA